MPDHIEVPRLRALTIWEPWVWCFTQLGKSGKFIENRDWKPLDAGVRVGRGDYIALHAGRTFDASAFDFVQQRFGVQVGIPREELFVTPEEYQSLPDDRRLESYMLGAVAAVARLYDVFEEIPDSSSQKPWRIKEKRYAWFFDEVWTLPSRVPCKGDRKLWLLPEDVLEDVCEQWGKASPIRGIGDAPPPKAAPRTRSRRRRKKAD